MATLPAGGLGAAQMVVGGKYLLKCSQENSVNFPCLPIEERENAGTSLRVLYVCMHPSELVIYLYTGRKEDSSA